MNIVLDPMTLLGLASASGVIVLLAVIADYVLSSMGYSKIALRRNISNNWLAWIPVVRYWTIGAIADSYDERKEIKRRLRFFLVALQAAKFAIVIPVLVYSLQLLPYFMEYGIDLFTYDLNNILLLVPIVGALIGFVIINAIMTVCYTIAVYKIFESTVPKNALIFTIIGAIIPLLNGVFVFISRNKGYDYVSAYYEDNEVEEEEDLTQLVEEQ